MEVKIMANETAEEYAKLVYFEALGLAQKTGFKVVHNEEGICPRCKKVGIFDLQKGYLTYGNSIYFSTVYNRWECQDCSMLYPGSDVY